jgi:hypothetical protein
LNVPYDDHQVVAELERGRYGGLLDYSDLET